MHQQGRGPLLFLCCLHTAKGANGNDFALGYSEARDDKERAALLDDARNRPHSFRYLQIMEMQDFTNPLPPDP